MAMKRKFESDVDDATNVVPPKQMKLVPFPQYGSDNDCVMSDAAPLFANHHIRIPSNASSVSSYSSVSPTTPPLSLEVSPLPLVQEVPMESDSQYLASAQPSPNVGLLQPHGGFVHHGSHCSSIPKLRVACAPGLNGQRTMWSFCEDCGAISMVNED
ncbi:hypothetical protein D9758_002078 [Tetrapyrgos nigripes]|uniref:Uncharacterized protein n=1 Tax=Tetrapyrgos nigripes TaxID=182062 RepID=A0A8H5GTA0_9AGAR|nr:hypothetical protein D9758_002078 [Tetrapyrgos nigripes]